MTSSLTIQSSTFMNIQDMKTINRDMSIINLNIEDLEIIDRKRQDFHSILTRNDMIKFMLIIKIINLDFFRRIIRIIRTIQTRFLQLLFLFIQARKSRIRVILTELKNHFSIQIKTSTIIHFDLIHSKTLRSRMTLHRRHVLIEFRNLRNFRQNRMNSIKKTTNTKARFITRRQRSLI